MNIKILVKRKPSYDGLKFLISDKKRVLRKTNPFNSDCNTYYVCRESGSHISTIKREDVEKLLEVHQWIKIEE